MYPLPTCTVRAAEYVKLQALAARKNGAVGLVRTLLGTPQSAAAGFRNDAEAADLLSD